MAHYSLAQLVEVLFRKGSREVVISPGSRSAPLTLAFARHEGFRKYVVPDERSAGYIALGMSQVTGRPVAMVCTSGTAAINYFPAVAEAFYLQVPLMVFTADRPPEWIDQYDGQTIRQEGIYGSMVKGHFSFPQEDGIPDVTWHRERIISEAFNLAAEYPAGPVHLNMPFREPLYPDPLEKYENRPDPKVIHRMDPEHGISRDSWNELAQIWSDSGNILIVGGQQRKSDVLRTVLQEFSVHFQVPVAGDVLSNLHGLGQNLIHLPDPILWKKDPNFLQPDLLISFGKSVISKNLKLFLRKYKPKHHWHLQPHGRVPDPFQSVTSQIAVDPVYFFRSARNEFTQDKFRKDFLDKWLLHEKEAGEKRDAFFPAGQFSELEAVNLVIRHLPESIFLHLANSMPVRLVNMLGGLNPGTEVFANRGTSGIDGCVSTALGSAIQSEKMNVLITGDMAFFYDRNAFWHGHNPGNLRIIILNNHGGGIFRMIDGPSALPEFEKYFETFHPLTARSLAGEFGFGYQVCDSGEALTKHLTQFFKPDNQVKILEIITESKTNKKIFDQFKIQFC